jgi:hypothetical protein
MHKHAIDTAHSLFLAGTLTAEQAAGYAGCTPESLAERFRLRGTHVDLPDGRSGGR